MHASGGPHGPYPDSAEPTMLTHRPAAAADSNPARAAPGPPAKLALAPPRPATQAPRGPARRQASSSPAHRASWPRDAARCDPAPRGPAPVTFSPGSARAPGS